MLRISLGAQAMLVVMRSIILTFMVVTSGIGDELVVAEKVAHGKVAIPHVDQPTVIAVCDKQEVHINAQSGHYVLEDRLLTKVGDYVNEVYCGKGYRGYRYEDSAVIIRDDGGSAVIDAKKVAFNGDVIAIVTDELVEIRDLFSSKRAEYVFKVDKIVPFNNGFLLVSPENDLAVVDLEGIESKIYSIPERANGGIPIKMGVRQVGEHLVFLEYRLVSPNDTYYYVGSLSEPINFSESAPLPFKDTKYIGGNVLYSRVYDELKMYSPEGMIIKISGFQASSSPSVSERFFYSKTTGKHYAVRMNINGMLDIYSFSLASD